MSDVSFHMTRYMTVSDIRNVTRCSSTFRCKGRWSVERDVDEGVCSLPKSNLTL